MFLTVYLLLEVSFCETYTYICLTFTPVLTKTKPANKQADSIRGFIDSDLKISFVRCEILSQVILNNNETQRHQKKMNHCYKHSSSFRFKIDLHLYS